MKILRRVRRRFAYFLQRKDFDRALVEEMQHHLELKTQKHINAGMTAELARSTALKEFGNPAILQEQVRSVWGVRALENLIQDVRYGLRTLGRNPGFSAVAILSLALGIGANTAIFSLINGIFLRKMVAVRPDELVALHRINIPEWPDGQFSYTVYDQLRNKPLPFSGMFAAHSGINISNIVYETPGSNGSTESGMINMVSGSFFSVLGINPIVGRTFTAQDDILGSPHAVAVLSYRYWQRRFGLDPNVVGKTFTISGTPFTIIGVAPKGFKGIFVEITPDFWVPLSSRHSVNTNSTLPGPPDENWLQIWGRLKPGLSMQQAAVQTKVVFKQLLPETDITKLEDSQQSRFLSQQIDLISESRGSNDLRDDLFIPILILAVIVASVLLIACANVANLLLARASARQKEIAVRLSLGASRKRLIRQLMTESLMLAVTGSLLGLGFTFYASDALVGLLSNGVFTPEIDLSPDYRVFGFTLAASFFSVIVFGLVPAVRGSRQELSCVLKGSISGQGKADRHRLGKILVVAQVAISLLLMICAGLFIRTLHNLRDEKLGFNKDGLLLLTYDNLVNDRQGTQRVNLYDQMLDQIESLPGVRSASISMLDTMTGNPDREVIAVTSEAHPQSENLGTWCNFVSGHYLNTIGMRLMLGREFSRRDDENSQKVVIINERLSNMLFGKDSPIGRYINLVDVAHDDAIEIVGVVGNAKYNDVREQQHPMAYIPLRQYPALLNSGVEMQVRALGDPLKLVEPIQRETQAIHKNLWAWNARPLASQIDDSLSEEKLVAKLSGLFGVIALLLASTGLYGVISYSVSRRTQEIGIRMAIGARPGAVLWMVLKETLLMVLIGLVIALAAAFTLSRLIASFLYGLGSNDPLTISLSVLTLVVAALLAGYIPARRASRVDQMIALRAE